MNLIDVTNPAHELDRVADALDWSLLREDWWGPARLAYDAEIRWLRECARSIAQEIRAIG